MIQYDGALKGMVRDGDNWSFEGKAFETPATEENVLACLDEAMTLPEDQEDQEKLLDAAHGLVFNQSQYTSQALLAIKDAYQLEVGGVNGEPDGDGMNEILAILQEAARRIACIEALTI